MEGRKVATITGSGSPLDGVEIYQLPDDRILLTNGQELTIDQFKGLHSHGWLIMEDLGAVPTAPEPAPEPEPVPEPEPEKISEPVFFPEPTPVLPTLLLLETSETKGGLPSIVATEKKKNRVLGIVVNFLLALLLLVVGFGIGYLYRDARSVVLPPTGNSTAVVPPVASSETTNTEDTAMKTCGTNMVQLERGWEQLKTTTGTAPKTPVDFAALVKLEVAGNLIQAAPVCPDNGIYTFTVKNETLTLKCSLHGTVAVLHPAGASTTATSTVTSSTP